MTLGFHKVLQKAETTQQDVIRAVLRYTPEERPLLLEELVAEDLEKLYRLAEQTPIDAGLGQELVQGTLESETYLGLTSKGLVKRFKQLFFRTQDQTVFGYNRRSAAWLAGPGYFRVDFELGQKNEFVLDYSRVPEQHPADAPAPKANTSGAYAGLSQHCRRICDGLYTLQNHRHNKAEAVFSVLLREPQT